MNISIFGLGYVGTVSLGCLAKTKNKVIGVDINKKKVDLINNAKSTILEPGLNELILSGIKNKIISATRDYKYAIKNTDISFICIGTPGKKNGNLNLISLFNSLKQIAEGLKLKKSFHTIVIRSTISPGSFSKIVGILEKHSGKRSPKDFCVIINPEFLREGSAVYDFFNPPFNIIGFGSDTGIKVLKKLYSNNKAPFIIVSENIAEIIKLISNAFHSLKISFANEIANLCKRLGVDSNEVMKLFSKDTKLNISSAYLKPGFAFGGSCLPKDLNVLNKIAKVNFIKLPLLSSINISNEYHKQMAYNLIVKLKEKNIGIWGLSFKIGTDDLRGSPILDLVKQLNKNGYNIKLYDQNVDFKKIIGANRQYIYKIIPGVVKLMEKDFDKFLKFSKILVVNSYDSEIIKKVKKFNHYKIVDLLNTRELHKKSNYYGLCW